MKSVIRRRRVSSIIGYNWANSGGGSTPDPGLVYLQQNAKLFYDFTKLPGEDGSVITTVNDLGPNGIGASNESPAESPVINYSQWGVDRIKLYKASATSGTIHRDVLIANTTGDDIFKTDFEVMWVGALANHNDLDFFGVANGATSNVIRCHILSNAIRFEYRYNAATARRFLATSPSSFFPVNERTGLSLFRIKCDFTNDIFKFWFNGVEITMTSSVDAFNLIDPTKWANNTYKLAIGGYNSTGTIFLYPPPRHQLQARFVVVPIMTDQQAIDTSNYLINSMPTTV